MTPMHESRWCVVCGDEYTPTGPKQRTCTEQCGRARAAERSRARKRGAPQLELKPGSRSEREVIPSGLAGALADVVIRAQAQKHDRRLAAFMHEVKLLNDAQREKDERAYVDQLHRVAAWALRELSHVRPTGDSSGS